MSIPCRRSSARKGPRDGGGVGFDAGRGLGARVGRESGDDLPEGGVIEGVAEHPQPDEERVAQGGGDELASGEPLVVGVAAAGQAAPDVDLQWPPPGIAPRPAQLADELSVPDHETAPVPEARVVPSGVQMQAHELDVGHVEDPAAHLDQVLVRDARLVDLDPEVDRDHQLGEVGSPPQLRKRGLHAEPDAGGPPQLRRDLLDEVDLADVLHGDADSGGHAAAEVVAALPSPVDRNAPGIHGRGEDSLQLLGRVHVGAGALVAQDVPCGQGRVGLECREDVDRTLGPGNRERVAAPAVVRAQLRLRGHEQRRPEALHEPARVAVLDEQTTAPHRQAVVRVNVDDG